jgi:hypothetical protein
MGFPEIVPTSRDFSPGDYPVKTFKAQNGAETRILYGDKRTNMKLSLTYANISDANADLFLTHYDEVKGTSQTFSVSATTKKGWSQSIDSLGATAQENSYRYESPPQLTQVRPGVSTVTVSLIGVL